MPRNVKQENNDDNFKEEENYSILFQTKSFDRKKVCLFSSYSFNGIVEEYVYYYLNELKKADFSIIFISTSPLKKTCVARLSSLCVMIIERENKCPDFGSWKIGLSLLQWGQLSEEVLLTNDSIFGPFFSLSPIISSMKKRYDVWGMTDNYEIEYHLQSYFLFVNKNVLLNNSWISFWKNVDLSLPKQEVINLYEIGLSKELMNAGFRLGAYAFADLVSKNTPHGLANINTSLSFWKLMIEQYDFPFLKREIIIRIDINKINWSKGLYLNVGTWRKVLEKHTDYPATCIDGFLTNYYNYIKKFKRDYVLRKRKLLFITHNADIGGAQRVLLNFLAWLRSNTDIPFETIVSFSSENHLLSEFESLGNVTLFYGLSEHEKQGLKERLIKEQVGLIFSNTIVNVDTLQFLSFLDVPQIAFVHELSYVLDAFPSIRPNISWLRKNIAHFVTCSQAVTDNLVKYLKIENDQTSLVHEFINIADNVPGLEKIRNLRKQLNIPSDAFVVGMCGTFEWRKSADLLAIIAINLCSKHKNIHLVWLGAEQESSLYKDISFDLEKATLKDRVHLVEKQRNSEQYFHLFDIFLMLSREDPFPLVNLESGLAGKPVICFDSSGGTPEYIAKGTGKSVPYLDIEALSKQVMDYYNNKGLLKEQATSIREIVKQNFTTEVQAPKLFDIICQHFDEKELTLTEEPNVTIMTHIYYENTWSEIKRKLKYFENGRNYFLFSISEACLIKEDILKDIKSSFRNSYVLITSNIGKDIGGKFMLIDLYLLLKLESTYIIFLHDKQSPQTLVGDSWKNNLHKIVDPANYNTILESFRDSKIGIVGAREHIINEYDSNTGIFRHNNDMTRRFIQKYNISLTNYEYLSGTMYWLRSSIIEDFFTMHDPIDLRKELEHGNVLDNYGDTIAHTWERMFCWIAAKNGYSIKGI